MAVTKKHGEIHSSIDFMMAFIAQEASEKAEEIEVKCEEEYILEKHKYFGKESLQILEYYKKKEDNIRSTKNIKIYQSVNINRLAYYNCLDDILENLVTDIAQKIQHDIESLPKYEPILEKLILQCLLKILEPQVIICCMKRDSSLVEKLSKNVAVQYLNITGKPVEILINRERHLHKSAIGGIEITSVDNHIKVTNTLRSRLDKIVQEMLPEIRYLIFGPNRHRKFKN